MHDALKSKFTKIVCMYLMIGKGQIAQKRPYWGENRLKSKILFLFSIIKERHDPVRSRGWLSLNAFPRKKIPYILTTGVSTQIGQTGAGSHGDSTA